MMPCVKSVSPAVIRRDLLIGANVGRWLFLRGSQEWTAETLFFYPGGDYAAFPDLILEAIRFHTCDARYQFLAALMHNGEYARAHYHAEKFKHEHETYLFICYYAKYLDCERRRLESLQDPTRYCRTADYLTSTATLPSFRNLLDTLRDENAHAKMRQNGPFQLLYGMVLSRLCHEEEAATAFVAALNAQPMLYCAWLELLRILPPDSRNDLPALRDRLPTHWMRDIFMAKALADFHFAEEADVYISELVRHGFDAVPAVISIQAQIELCRREEKYAVAALTKLQDSDPLRLDDFDTLSHLYFLSGQKEELARLAQAAVTVDKWNEKSLCTVGNYYATRGEHEKAVIYFTRAVTVNPSYSAVWVLIGHSYIELRNPQMAIKAYTYAVKANPRDCTGWYGVGQAYEIFKMPSYAIEYFSQAHLVSPHDQRFLIALGDVYEKTGRIKDARRAYWKAYKCRQRSNLTEAVLPLSRLGTMFEQHLQLNYAANVYTELVDAVDKSDEVTHHAMFSSVTTRHDSTLIAHAYLFLAKQAFRNAQTDSDFEEALRLATLCRRFPDVRAETTALLQQITARQKEPKLDSFLLHNVSVSTQRLTRAQTRRIAEQFKRTSHDVLGAAEAAVAAASGSMIPADDDDADLPSHENEVEPIVETVDPPPPVAGRNRLIPNEATNTSRFATSTPGSMPLAPFSPSPLSLRRRSPRPAAGGGDSSSAGSSSGSGMLFRRRSIFNNTSNVNSNVITAATTSGNTLAELIPPIDRSFATSRAFDQQDEAFSILGAVENDLSRQSLSTSLRYRSQQRTSFSNNLSSASSSDLSELLDEFHIDTHSNSNADGFEVPEIPLDRNSVANIPSADEGVREASNFPDSNIASGSNSGTSSGNAGQNPTVGEMGWNDDDLIGDL